MSVDIKFSQSYFWLDSWIMANILQLGTEDFCTRFIDYTIDPGRRLYDQMAMAARSGTANIAEGTARHSTSIETELKLLDVARASIDELQGDLFHYLLRKRAEVWPIGNQEREDLWKMELDAPKYSNSLLHDAGKHILRQKAKFDPWLENESPCVVANALLVLCARVNRMLESQMRSILEMFRNRGGFTENMTSERIEALRQQAENSGAPKCPKCGAAMVRRLQRKGQNKGREFWGCSNYPNCNGILSIR